MTDDTDDHDGQESRFSDAIDVFEAIEDRVGQEYVTNDYAWDCLSHFADAVTNTYVFEHHPYAGKGEQISSPSEIDGDARLTALSMHLMKEQQSGTDTRGIVHTFPHQQVVTIEQVGRILVRALGESRSRARMAGAGSTADARHNEQMETLKFALDDYTVDAGEVPSL